MRTNDTSDNDSKRLTVQQDRRLIRNRWHSHRFVVAHVTAPEAETDTERQPVNLAFVIDRSGSMAGNPIRLAMQAVEEAIGRLKATDRFSVVAFDDQVESIVTGVHATPAAKAKALTAIRRVDARGTTDLGAGWLRGCELVATELLELGVNRTLLLTDGQANRGMTTLEELEHHAAELRKRGVSTSTFGVGDNFIEPLLAAMAQAGGGQFYDIGRPEQIRDHIESEVGETLEIVARGVTLDLGFPAELRLESLGAFHASVAGNRAVIDLGDLVSGQQVDVPLRFSFPFGEVDDAVMAVFGLSDRDGVFAGNSERVAWRFADDRANDEQPREREVDRLIAGVYAARARQVAVRRNRDGDYDGAREALRATARKIRGYAGEDPELQPHHARPARAVRAVPPGHGGADAQGALRGEQPRAALAGYPGQGDQEVDLPSLVASCLSSVTARAASLWQPLGPLN